MKLLQEVRSSLGPLEHALRSDALKPNRTLDANWSNKIWSEVVSEVVEKRSKFIDQSFSQTAQEDQSDGRLLLYVPSENLACGAAQHSSNGFFDVNNVPPWDIWVDFADDTLICWAPNSLVGAAQIGIDVNPESCIRWAD